MSFVFRPAKHINEGTGVFVALTGTTNSGKTYSALELARGIAGEGGKIAVLDTEGGRTLHLRDEFDFDAMVMGAPFHPDRFAEAAQDAETAGYACLVIDSFTMEWKGLGGVLEWADEELQRMAGDDHAKRERMKMASWIKPKTAHKAMVASLLQRRIPIVFSIRGEESIKPVPGGAPARVFKSLTEKGFPFEMTVAFRLDPTRKGYIDLSDATSWKMEGAHREIFQDGSRISREQGAKLKAWSTGLKSEPKPAEPSPLAAESLEAASRGSDVLKAFWSRLTSVEKHTVGGANELARLKKIAGDADRASHEEPAALQED